MHSGLLVYRFHALIQYTVLHITQLFAITASSGTIDPISSMNLCDCSVLSLMLNWGTHAPPATRGMYCEPGSIQLVLCEQHLLLQLVLTRGYIFIWLLNFTGNYLSCWVTGAARKVQITILPRAAAPLLNMLTIILFSLGRHIHSAPYRNITLVDRAQLVCWHVMKGLQHCYRICDWSRVDWERGWSTMHSLSNLEQPSDAQKLHQKLL